MTNSLLPARRALNAAEQTNQQRGDENLGFLSVNHGFMPVIPPRTALPTSHRPWDEVANQLPDLYRSLRLRAAFDALPLLSATAADLPEPFLLRSSAMLSIFAHAYARAEPGKLLPLPDALRVPWQQVTARLGRKAPVLSYIDLIVYNWQLREPTSAAPRSVETMRLLLPTVGNQEEQIFYLTQVEMLAQCTPVVSAAVRAQEAVMHDDRAALKRELIAITDQLYAVTHGPFMQINPNPHSRHYVDPIVWAKTVAPFAVPIHEGVQGPSGTSSPIFHLLDLFFERQTYASMLGQESMHLRTWYPPHWQAFLAAIGELSVRDYVETTADRELAGLYQEAHNAYVGEDGFLGRHRLKVYGYLELAFKIGRTVTIGGFSGLFQDRTWDEVDDALEAARLERAQRGLTGWHAVTAHAHPASSPQFAAQENIAHTVLVDIAGAGIRYHPGDRCCLLPENDPALVAKTLRALNAGGDELILLNQAWRQAMALRTGNTDQKQLTLRNLLCFGQIRPVERPIAKLLYRITANATLAQIIATRDEDQWELWDLLAQLVRDGFNPATLWPGHPADRDTICWIVPPERYRMYSIASPAAQTDCATQLQLLAGQLRYTTPAAVAKEEMERLGTASSFLARITQATEPQSLSIKLIRPPRFHLPADPMRPLVLFAGGTGIAPFRGFIQQRREQPNAGPIWLFYATRTRDDLPFERELAAAVAQGALTLQVAFSQADVDLEFPDDSSGVPIGFRTVPRPRRYINQVMCTENNTQLLWHLLCGDAVFYICGRADFAHTVMEALKAIISSALAEKTADRTVATQQLLYRLIADERLHREVYTTYTKPHAQASQQINLSTLVLHNNDNAGHWMLLDGRVYELTEFLQMHPGGAKILQGYTGMDGTPAYRKVLHHVRPEVHAQLALYEIGVVRRLQFGAGGAIALTAGRPRYVTTDELYRAWVRFLYLVVEMENALENDFAIGEGALTAHEMSGESSAYKLQLLVEVHKRFLYNYLDGLTGTEVRELWAMVIGLCAPNADVRWFPQTLTSIMQGQDAQHVKERVELLAQQVNTLTTATHDRLMPQLRQLEQEDKRLLLELKMQLRQGLLLFEQHEESVLRLANHQLLTVLRQLPNLFADFFARLAKIGKHLR